MKLTLKYKKDFLALFSNLGMEDENTFYVLATFHKSRKGGFGEGITVAQADKTLKKHNPNYKFLENDHAL